jgi:alpha-tubulin suppressor-like RCC1 family protein
VYKINAGNFMSRAIFISILATFSFTLSGQIVDGGNGHAIILDKQGNVWTIGRNNFGQLGDNTLENSPTPKKIKTLNNIVAISRGYDHSIALDKNGNLFLWGRNNFGQLGCPSINDQLIPQKLPNHTNFIAVEGGHWHTAGLKKDGTVWCWGHNSYGQLGDNTIFVHKSSPVQTIAGGTNWKQVSGGYKQTAAVTNGDI